MTGFDKMPAENRIRRRPPDAGACRLLVVDAPPWLAQVLRRRNLYGGHDAGSHGMLKAPIVFLFARGDAIENTNYGFRLHDGFRTAWRHNCRALLCTQSAFLRWALHGVHPIKLMHLMLIGVQKALYNRSLQITQASIRESAMRGSRQTPPAAQKSKEQKSSPSARARCARGASGVPARRGIVTS